MERITRLQEAIKGEDITIKDFKTKIMQKIYTALEKGTIAPSKVEGAVVIVKLLLSSGVIGSDDKKLFDAYVKYNYR